MGYTELFSLITWTSVGLMGATSAVAGQNLGAGHPERAAQSAVVAARFGLVLAGVVGLGFVLIPRVLLGAFGLSDGIGYEIGRQLLAYLAISGLLRHGGAHVHRGDYRAPAIRRARSTFRSSRRSSSRWDFARFSR